MAAITSAPEKGKFKTRRRRVTIDMTPMVDLAFLLLTFFVLTSRLVNPVAMELHIPHEPETPDHRSPIPHDKVLNLVLGKNNTLHWYVGMPGNPATPTDFSKDGIRKVLQEKNRMIHKMYVLVKPSDESRYQNTIDILDELAIAGITRYSLVTPEADDIVLVQ